MPSKNTILKAIHNISRQIKELDGLRMPSKNTILKAIHNFTTPAHPPLKTANAK